MSQAKPTIHQLFSSREAAERLHLEALWRRLEWELGRLSIPARDRLELLATCVGRFLGRSATPEQLRRWIADVKDAAAEAQDPGQV